MILTITGTYRGVAWTNFSMYVSKEDDAFEVISSFVGHGLILREARLTSGKNKLLLPIEAFDGQAIGPQLAELQQEWQQILYPSVSPN